MRNKKQGSFFVRPDSEKSLSKLAEEAIKKADAFGILPTPIDELISASKISNVDEMDALQEGFLSKLVGKSKDTFKTLMQKIRGIADLREKVIYVPREDNHVRSLFPKAHELGHQVIPWHHIDRAYLDDNRTLSPSVEAVFEQEANFFASEILFQGKLFRKEVRDYQPSFPAIMQIADHYGTSIQSTIWRYVEEQDEKIAVAQFYPDKVFDGEGNQVLSLWKIVCSPNFTNKYGEINVPFRIRTGHPWVAARDLNMICDGNDIFECGKSQCSLGWYSFWNNYALIVLLRETPKLGVVGKIFG